MVMVPVTATLPLAIRLVGRGMAGAVATGGLGTGLMGGGVKGRIFGGLLAVTGLASVAELIDQTAELFGGDETKATEVFGFVKAWEDAMDSGAIMVPEAPRGYDGTIYQQRLNYGHWNFNNGNIWVSDFSNGRNHR